MFNDAQHAALAAATCMSPLSISGLTSAATRARVSVVLENGTVVPTTEEQREQLRLLVEDAARVDVHWLRVSPTHLYFVTNAGDPLPLVLPPPPLASESMHIVLDKSGSMRSVDGAAYEGAREIVSGLPEDAVVTITTFSSDVQMGVRKSRDEALATLSLREASGATKLYDAILQAVRAEMENPSELVTIVVVTDGWDTASSATVAQVRDAVTRFQETENWRLLFMGSNQDAVLAAQTMGIPVGRALTVGGGGDNLQRAMRIASESTSAFRGGRVDGFTSAHRSASVRS